MSESLWPEPPAWAGLAEFSEMFDAHAAHLFDYCSALASRESAAIDATALALTRAAQARLPDPDHLRARLFAVGRQECLAGGYGICDYAPAAFDPQVRRAGAAYWSMPSRYREVLDLAYRHCIRSHDLPFVLGVTADDAATLLVAAEEEFGQAAALELRPGSAHRGLPHDGTARGFGLEYIADLPLAPLPAAVWDRSVQAVVDGSLRPRGQVVVVPAPDRPARRAGRTLRIAGLGAVPVIAAGVVLGYVVAPTGGRPAVASGAGDIPVVRSVAAAAPDVSTDATTAPAAHPDPSPAPSLPSAALFPALRSTAATTPSTTIGTVTVKSAPKPRSAATSAPAPAATQPSSAAATPAPTAASPSPSTTASSPSPSSPSPSSPSPSSPSPSSPGSSSPDAPSPTPASASPDATSPDPTSPDATSASSDPTSPDPTPTSPVPSPS